MIGKDLWGRLAYAVLLSVFFFAPAAEGLGRVAEPGIEVNVRLNAHDSVSIRISNLSGPLTFEKVAGYSREGLWKVDVNDGQISGDTLVPALGKREITIVMELIDALPRPDRTYAPYLRISDGSVVVLHQFFVPTKNAVVAFEKPHIRPCEGGGEYKVNTIDSAGDGYHLLGDFKCIGGRGYTIMYADGEAEALAANVASEVGSISRYYTRMMDARRDFSVIIYLSRNREERTTWFHGDSLGTGLTLGFAKSAGAGDWQKYDPSNPAGYLAHEVFHQWNGSHAIRAAPPEFTLATEGGAEVAALFYSREVGKLGIPDVWDFLITRTNACVTNVGFGQSIAGALIHDSLGRIPYDCGAVWSLIASKIRSQPNASGFFSMWKNILREASKVTVSLHSVCGENCGDGDGFIKAEGIAPTVTKIFQIPLVGHPGVDESEIGRHAVFSQIFRQLMQIDCGGQYGFTEGADSLALDVRITSCKTLSKIKAVSMLGSASIHSRPPIIFKEVNRSCEQTGFITARGTSRSGTVGVIDETDALVPCNLHIDESSGFISRRPL